MNLTNEIIHTDKIPQSEYLMLSRTILIVALSVVSVMFTCLLGYIIVKKVRPSGTPRHTQSTTLPPYNLASEFCRKSAMDDTDVDIQLPTFLSDHHDSDGGDGGATSRRRAVNKAYAASLSRKNSYLSALTFSVDGDPGDYENRVEASNLGVQEDVLRPPIAVCSGVKSLNRHALRLAPQISTIQIPPDACYTEAMKVTKACECVVDGSKRLRNTDDKLYVHHDFNKEGLRGGSDAIRHSRSTRCSNALPYSWRTYDGEVEVIELELARQLEPSAMDPRTFDWLSSVSRSTVQNCGVGGGMVEPTATSTVIYDSCYPSSLVSAAL